MLTTGVDAGAAFVGTEKGDIFVGSVSNTLALDTLNKIDTIDGGAGIDTLKISDDTGTVVVPNMSNIEIIEVTGVAGVTVDTTATTGVTDLNIIKAAGAINADAGSTTNVTVNMKAANAAVAVDGGKDVNVTLTDVTAAADTVAIGGTVAATGDVTVNMTGSAYTAATASHSTSAVTVTGGKTISVTQKATSDSSAAATDTSAATITQGAVTVLADANTTTVTVKQDAAVTAVNHAAAVTGVATTQEVVFTAMAAGDTASLDFGAGILTFTAKKALNASEVASAFANLAAGDDQGNASAVLGLYTDNSTNTIADLWTSGPVIAVSETTSKVVFSSTKTSAVQITNNAASVGVSSVGTLVAGVDAVDAVTGVMGVSTGAVTINDKAVTLNSIKTITVDGYATGSVIGTTNATTALATLNLANAQGNELMTVADTATTLALTVEKLGSSVTSPVTGGVTQTNAQLIFTAAPETLNLTTTGDNYVTLTAAATKTLNVNGTGLFTSTADLAALETVVVSGTAGLKLNGAEDNTLISVNTTATTGAVTASIQGNKATYTGGAGVDTVTVTNAGTNAISKAIDLGAGDDKLTLVGTVLTPTVEVKGGAGTDTLSMSAASAEALSATTAFAAKVTGFERLEIGLAGDAAVNAVAANQDVNVAKLGYNYVITNGSDEDTLRLIDMANNATVVLSAAGLVEVQIKDAALVASTADVLNVITNSTTGTAGTLTANNVETINVTVNDTDTSKTLSVDNTSTNTLTLVADKAATINVNGAGNLNLTLNATDTAVTLIDASKATGKLEVITLSGDLAATTVKGGAGNDTITLKGAGDVAIGGAGDDILIVSGTTATAVTLTGGEGNDTFDVSGFNSLGNAGSAVTITDLQSGETIKFATTGQNFVSSKVTLIAESTFTEYVAEAAKVANNATGADGIAWFQLNSNTFVVQDIDESGTFNTGDIIVKINGVKDLSTASFNVTDGTLEIA